MASNSIRKSFIIAFIISLSLNLSIRWSHQNLPSHEYKSSHDFFDEFYDCMQYEFELVSEKICPENYRNYSDPNPVKNKIVCKGITECNEALYNAGGIYKATVIKSVDDDCTNAKSNLAYENHLFWARIWNIIFIFIGLIFCFAIVTDSDLENNRENCLKIFFNVFVSCVIFLNAANLLFVYNTGYSDYTHYKNIYVYDNTHGSAISYSQIAPVLRKIALESLSGSSTSVLFDCRESPQATPVSQD